MDGHSGDAARLLKTRGEGRERANLSLPSTTVAVQIRSGESNAG
jgi:hypothetical protein